MTLIKTKVKQQLRKLPSVEKILEAAQLQPEIDLYSRVLVTRAAQEVLAPASSCTPTWAGRRYPGRRWIPLKTLAAATIIWK
jgi:hypothetical protein